MILAPGQTARLSSYPGLTPGLLLERALRITNTFLYELWPAILIFLVLLAVYFIKSKENRWKNLANTRSLKKSISQYEVDFFVKI